jgi:hypothetical protein
VLHLLFKCPLAIEVWMVLGMHDFINDASQLDRSGSVVLEYILRLEDNSIEGFQNINLKEVVLVCC